VTCHGIASKNFRQQKRKKHSTKCKKKKNRKVTTQTRNVLQLKIDHNCHNDYISGHN
jgi:hypothetical protein